MANFMGILMWMLVYCTGQIIFKFVLGVDPDWKESGAMVFIVMAAERAEREYKRRNG